MSFNRLKFRFILTNFTILCNTFFLILLKFTVLIQLGVKANPIPLRRYRCYRTKATDSLQSPHKDTNSIHQYPTHLSNASHAALGNSDLEKHAVYPFHFLPPASFLLSLSMTANPRASSRRMTVSLTPASCRLHDHNIIHSTI